MHFTGRESASPELHPGADEALCDREDPGLRCGMRAVLDALPEEIALLDRTGRIRFVNAAWRRFARENGLRLADAGVGASYLTACDGAAAELPLAAEAALHVRAAIAGRDGEVQLPYVCEWSGGARWFISRVSAFGEGGERCVVVSHAEVTELKEAEAALHELTTRLLVAQDDERRRIARELHDGTAPTMVALSLDLTRLASRLPPGKERDLAEDCAALCEQSLRELRTVSFVLHPPLLERAGLVDALRWLADGFGKRSGIAVALGVEAAPRERLSSDVELSLYRIAQEALTNVQRHSGSHTARVDLAADDVEVRLTIRDEGIPPQDLVESGGGVGIASMRERVRSLGGRLELDCGTSGTTVIAVVPRTPRGAQGSTSRFRIA